MALFGCLLTRELVHAHEVRVDDADSWIVDGMRVGVLLLLFLLRCCKADVL